MAQHWSLKDAFRHFGAVAKNPRWSWSAVSPDGKTVVLTWWTDEVSRDGDKLIRDERDHPRFNIWRKKPGNKDRVKNLVWARDHCDSLFRVVWITAKDPAATVREAVKRHPDPNLWMRLTFLDEETGKFRAESVTR